MNAASFHWDLVETGSDAGKTRGRQHWEGTLRGLVVIAVLSAVLLASYGTTFLQL